jgi:hypothetical protein
MIRLKEFQININKCAGLNISTIKTKLSNFSNINFAMQLRITDLYLSY